MENSSITQGSRRSQQGSTVPTRQDRASVSTRCRYLEESNYVGCTSPPAAFVSFLGSSTFVRAAGAHVEEEEGGGGVIFIYTSFLRQGNIEALICNDIFSINRTSFFSFFFF